MAASGLLELSRWITDPARRSRYRDAARKTITSLTNSYLATGEARRQGRILLHGTLHKPASLGVDESLIFGDYYYLEALLKLIEKQGAAAGY
jgi:unsaturated chondroitin disaccharide hydrolase